MANSLHDDELLELIFRVVDSDAHWSDLLAALANEAEADNAALLLQDLRSGESRGYDWGFEESARQAYYSYYASVNPWMQRVDGTLSPGFVAGDSFLPLSRLVHTEFHTDWGKRHDVVHTAAAALKLSSGTLLYLSLNRGQGRGAFSEESFGPLTKLLPHLHRALAISDQLDRLKAAQAAARDLATAVLLLDRHCRVTDANRSGEELLRDLPSCMRRDSLERLAIVDRYGADQLEPRILSLIEPGTLRDAIFAAEHRAGTLICHLKRLEVPQSAVHLRRPVVRLAVIADEPKVGELELVRRLYGLTGAETRLAADLLQVGALDLLLKARAERGYRISRETAKTHLEALFRKTNTRRQGELIRNLSHLAAALPAGKQEEDSNR